jgi:phosphohistidine phosphatase
LSDLGQEPHSVVTSTAVRARKTAELAAEAGSWNCSIRPTDDLYLASPEALLLEARAEANGVERLMLVGHEPTWSDAVELFCGGGRIRMVTAALARLDFPGDDWSRIDFGVAALAWIVTPKLLEVAPGK